jgi:hypothetical protein
MPDEKDYLWDPRAAPDPEIERLERALRPLGYEPRPFDWSTVPIPPARRRRPYVGPLAAAAAALLVVAGAWRMLAAPASGWRVETIDGAPMLSTVSIDQTARMTAGQSLVTDSLSSARIDVGSIGTAAVGPNSRVRLVRSRGTEHRLALERGSLHARIWAPPRFFLVETPSALAVDLGCVYTLDIDEQGVGVLTVHSGQVELVQNGRRSLVTAGTAAAMRPRAGPGTPFPVSSSRRFRESLAAIDVGADSGDALDLVLREAAGQGTISLWHLLSRVRAADRGRIYDRLSALSAPPKGVTRDGIIALDRRMLSRWKNDLEPTWSNEKVAVWRRVWRWAWSYVTTREDA